MRNFDFIKSLNLNVLNFKVGGQFTFPKSAIVKNQSAISGTKRNMSKKIIKSDRPTYNSNRIINKRQEGGDLTYNMVIPPKIDISSFWHNKSIDYPDIISNSLKSEDLTDLSDINKQKSLTDIMQEVSQPMQQKQQRQETYTQTLSANLSSSINKYTGIPYQFGGKTKSGIDCSGFTSKVMQDMGIKLTGGTINQWKQVSKIGVNDLKVGDLVFLKGTISGRQKDLPSHVAIVTDTSNLSSGKIKVAEASGRGKTSQNGREWDLTKGYYKDHWLGAGRVFNYEVS